MKKTFSILCAFCACAIFANSVMAYTDVQKSNDTPQQNRSTTEVVQVDRQYSDGTYTKIEFTCGKDGIISHAKLYVSKPADDQTDSGQIFWNATCSITHHKKEAYLSYSGTITTIKFDEDIKYYSADIVNDRIIDKLFLIASETKMPQLAPRQSKRP